MSFLQLIAGKPLATSEERAEHIGPISGIPVFGLDALSSAAYGPEAALTLLIPLGAAGIAHIVPISFAIVALLAVVFFSYCQTIDGYPHGGGSYTVASENLGETAGLFAAAALMIDYILNAAVGISAGVEALVSAFPLLLPHTLAFCLAILALLTLINIRGTRDTGIAFLIPTYMFIGTLIAVIGIGAIRTIGAHAHPVPIVAPPHLPAATSMLSLWLLAKVFSSGCTAMTGVEAVSNGTAAFRDPTQRNAKRTLTIIIVLLMIFLSGIALLCRAYNIGATDPASTGYQSILSQLISAVMGRGWFYYVGSAYILAVLALSANTSYADFPRLTRVIAMNDYLPHVFKIRGRRLLYSHGIVALVGFTAVLLIAFGGVTDRLIPLFAIGAFMAFTLSQAGMVIHWKKQGGRGSLHRMIINGIGAIATGLTLIVVLVAKFTAGAWIVAILIPALIFLMLAVKGHYRSVGQEIAIDRPIRVDNLTEPLVIVPLDHWSRITEKGLRFAMKLSDHVEAIHVDAEGCRDEVAEMWQRNVARPIEQTGKAIPKLTFLTSPYRFVLMPLVEHILQVERELPTGRSRSWFPSWLLNTGGKRRSTTSAPKFSKCFSWCAAINELQSSTFPGIYSCSIPDHISPIGFNAGQKIPMSSLPTRQQFHYRVVWNAGSAVVGCGGLSLPYALPDGRLFPQRSMTFYLAFCLIFTTLVLQGLTMSTLIRIFGVGR